MVSYDNSDSYSENSSWYPDFGASSHVTFGLNDLIMNSEYQGTDRVHIGNGTRLKNSHYGNSNNTKTFLLKTCFMSLT